MILLEIEKLHARECAPHRMKFHFLRLVEVTVQVVELLQDDNLKRFSGGGGGDDQ